jgi:hypothetical protein
MATRRKSEATRTLKPFMFSTIKQCTYLFEENLSGKIADHQHESYYGGKSCVSVLD